MKVTKILDTQFKTGKTAKGKPWTLVKIEAEGKTATGFGPVVVGDEVDLTFNEQYDNYSFKVLKPSVIPDPPIKDTNQEILELIYEDTEEILKILKASEIPIVEDDPNEIFPDWVQRPPISA